MKCIRCGRDSKYRERTGMRCPGCRKEFAFEPQKRDPLTDAAFQAAIDAVSANGSVRWGVEHLYYEVCRRLTKGRVPGRAALPLAAVFVVVGWVIAAATGTVFLGVGATAVGALVLVARLPAFRSPTVALTLDRFNAMWDRWQKVHGTPKGVIARKEAPSRPRTPEPDLGDYSFDRAVICDRARTVDLLLANNFHFENNCAVLSVGGYPPGPFETVRAMLQRNPRLQVFALHDASVAGCQVAQKLAGDPAWFKDQVPVTDVGLRPSHAPPFRGLWLPSPTGPVPAGPGITAEEAAWLSRHTLELAAIRPEQVLKRLFRALNRKSDERDSDTGPSGGGDSGSWTSTAEGSRVEQDAESFQADAADTDGGADSFG